MRRIVVTAGSRIHFGFYNIKSSTTAYGSIGVYIEEPRTIVEIKLEDASSIGNVAGPLTQRELGLLEKVAESYCGQGRPGLKGASITVHSSPPRHVGLGSTTQLLLSTATGLVYCCRRNKISVPKLATMLRRGLASGIGIYGFWKGGFMVDSGRRYSGKPLSPPKSPKELPKLLFRARLPKKWAFLLVIPINASGLHEEEEEPLISSLPEIDNETNARLTLTFLSKVLRGVLEGDLKLFGSGVNIIQDTVGEVFSRYQGGRYASIETEKTVEMLRKLGAAGAGQSSWGPLAYGIFHAKHLRESLHSIKRELYRENINARVFVTHARNRGYVISRDPG